MSGFRKIIFGLSGSFLRVGGAAPGSSWQGRERCGPGAHDEGGALPESRGIGRALAARASRAAVQLSPKGGACLGR